MQGSSILVCSADPLLRQEFVHQLACAGSKVIEAEQQLDAIRALDSECIDLAIVDVTHFHGGMGLLDIAMSICPTIAITPGHDLGLLSTLVCGVGVSHVMARPEDPAALLELLVTAEKLLRQELFGLEKYISGDRASLRQRVLTSSAECAAELEGLTSFLRSLKAPRHIVATITNAADEMLTNAMYNAPVDHLGMPLYAATNRRTKLQLRPHEHVGLSYGTTDTTFGISVVDQFGRLSHAHLRKSIDRCVNQADPIEQKEGGAGLGLFLIARTAHQFVVNVAPREQTEVIALWDLDRKKLHQQRAHHSLHYFEREAPEPLLLTRRRASGTRAPTNDWDSPSTNPGFN